MNDPPPPTSGSTSDLPPGLAQAAAMAQASLIAGASPQLIALRKIVTGMDHTQITKLVVFSQDLFEIITTHQILQAIGVNATVIQKRQKATMLQSRISDCLDLAGAKVIICYSEAVPNGLDFSAVAHKVVFLGDVSDVVYDQCVALTDGAGQGKLQYVFTIMAVESAPSGIAMAREEIKPLLQRRLDNPDAPQTPSQIRKTTRAEKGWPY